MLTGMTEADWDIALETFRGCLPRQGDAKGPQRTSCPRVSFACGLILIKSVRWA